MRSRFRHKNSVKMDPSWTGRRLAVRGILLGSLGLALYSMYLGVDMATVVMPTLGIIVSATIATYIGGASYERCNGVQSLNEYSNYSESRSDYRRDTTRYQEQSGSSSINLIEEVLRKGNQ